MYDHQGKGRTMTTKTVPVTMRALTQRINRKLKQDDQVLKAARTDQTRMDVGQFYIVDYSDSKSGYVARHDVDLEELGRELGVLEQWESLSGEDR
jgi:hypothetical protein